MPVISIRNSLLGTCAIAALTLAVTNGAHAQTPINGGGSSLAQPTYNALFNQYESVIDTTVHFNYGGGGSGAGQRGVLCNDATNDVGNVLAPPQATHANNIVAGNTIHYGGSDATLTTQQITNWNNSVNVAPVGTASAGAACATSGTGTLGKSTGGPLVQVPTFGVPITLAFNLVNQRFKSDLQLTDDQICRIFSAKVTTWDALTGVNANGTTAPTGPITVVFRADNSGTTFLFTQHLNAVCTPGVNTPAGFTFTATQGFASLFSPLPANFTAASLSSGVQTAIGLNARNHRPSGSGILNSIGYLSPDYTTVSPTNQTATTTYPPVAAVKNDRNPGAGFVLPTVANTLSALASGAAPTTVAQIKDPSAWVPTIANPASGYPVVGYTVWVLPTCYADPTVGFTVSSFLNSLYNDVNFIGVVQQNGFAPVDSALQLALNSNIIANNPATNVDIMNSDLCQSVGGSTYAGR